MTAIEENLDALDAGMCTAQCILSKDDKECDCRCAGKFHGLMRLLPTANAPITLFRRLYGEFNIGNVTLTQSEHGTWQVALVLDEYTSPTSAQDAADIWQSAINLHMRETLSFQQVEADPERYADE